MLSAWHFVKKKGGVLMLLLKLYPYTNVRTMPKMSTETANFLLGYVFKCMKEPERKRVLKPNPYAKHDPYRKEQMWQKES